MSPRILVVDDHEIVREGVKTLLARARPLWEICGEATNGHDALIAVSASNPDVIILDITMPGLSGLEVASQILRIMPACRIVMFTMHESEMLESEVRDSGAHGFVLKSDAARSLISAIETLLAGGTFYGVARPKEPSAAAKPNPGMAFWGMFSYA